MALKEFIYSLFFVIHKTKNKVIYRIFTLIY